MGDPKSVEITTTKLQRISKLSRENDSLKFKCLMPHFSKENLIACFNELDGRKAIGVDKQSKEDYALHLEVNIATLLSRLKTMSYRPRAVREVLIPKDNGKFRPLGIACVEDKIVQMMTYKLLEAIYEPLFLDCSYGFRPSRNCHQAVKTVNDFIFRNRFNYVIDVDLENYFGSINHEKLLEILRLKISDERFIRYIARMLKAGVLSEQGLRKNMVGTTQGSICSPILANIFAHYALDSWLENVVKPRISGEFVIARYCDDFVICCNNEIDSQRILKALAGRLSRFSLRFNKEKSRVVQMHKSKFLPGFKPDNFSFLGFTFVIGKTITGFTVPKVITSKNRMSKTLREINNWCRIHRHRFGMLAMWNLLRLKMVGYRQYYCVSTNIKAVAKVLRQVERIFFKWINRRSQRKSINWGKYKLFLSKYPMPKPYVIHRLF